MDQNIQIAIRIKPFQNSQPSQSCCWNQNYIQFGDKNAFSFDYVIDPQTTQQYVFEKIGFKIISNVLEGYNGCIFAYGQTGSGKTFTMTGTQNQDGVVQRCLKTLWHCVRESDFSQIKVSYFEIYNESIKDLLTQKQNLSVRENSKNGFYVQNLSEHVVERFDEMEELIRRGISVRTVKQTRMNQLSSRSHSILQVKVCYKSKQNDGLNVFRNAKITFIDLAGSEKQKQTQVEGQRLKQAANINKSLSNLSLVISKLSQNSQKKTSAAFQIHIPFRNSVLTKILKNSLTGKSKIIIVCTISVQDRYLDETFSTLRFAQTAKSIKLKVKKNQQQFDGTKDRLFVQFQEVKKQYEEMKYKIDELSKQNEDLKRQNAKLKDSIQVQQTENNELQISLQCMRIQSLNTINQIRTQSMSQSLDLESNRFYGISSTNSQYQFGNNKSQLLSHSQAQPFQSGFIDQGQLPKYFQKDQSSQLSFFTTNLSSQFNSPQKNQQSFFVIEQASQKQQYEVSQEFKDKLQQKNKSLEVQLNKLKIQNQFLNFEKETQQAQIQQYCKKLVFRKLTEEQIKQDQKSFKQLLRNKQFSHAQLKFLKLCIQKSNKDKMELQLIEQQKKSLNLRYNQNLQRVKHLLYQKAQLAIQRQEQGKMTPDSRKYFMNSSQNISTRKQKDNNKRERVLMNKQTQIYSKSFNKEAQKSSQVFSQTKQTKNIANFKSIPEISQQMKQSVGFTQNSQLFIGYNFRDSQSFVSQTTNKLSNNQLEYLKKDYQKLSYELKGLKEQVQKSKILLIEKDSLIRQKQGEIDSKSIEINNLLQNTEQLKYLLQLQINKNHANNNTMEEKILQKQRQLNSMNCYLQDLQRKQQFQSNQMRLKLKNFQLQNKNLVLKIQNGEKELQNRHQQNQLLKQKMQELQNQKEELQIQFGLVNSENEVFRERYNEFKEYLKHNGRIKQPKKIFSKRTSFYSISQEGQNYSNNKNTLTSQLSNNYHNENSSQFNNLYQHSNNNSPNNSNNFNNFSNNLLNLNTNTNSNLNLNNNPTTQPQSQLQSHLQQPQPHNLKQQQIHYYQLSQKQYKEIIENKRFKYMHQAACYYYQKTLKLINLKQQYKGKISELETVLANAGSGDGRVRKGEGDSNEGRNDDRNDDRNDRNEDKNYGKGKRNCDDSGNIQSRDLKDNHNNNSSNNHKKNNSNHQLLQSLYFQIEKLTKQLHHEKSMHFQYKEKYLEIKEKSITIKSQLLQQQDTIQNLISNCNQYKIHSQLLETKLKQKQQKLFENKQIINNYNAETHQLPSDYYSKHKFNSKQINFSRIRRISDSSESSLSSQATVVRGSNYSKYSKRSRQIPRSQQMNYDQFEQIKQASKQSDRQKSENSSKIQQLSQTPLLTRTITNLNLIERSKSSRQALLGEDQTQKEIRYFDYQQEEKKNFKNSRTTNSQNLFKNYEFDKKQKMPFHSKK